MNSLPSDWWIWVGIVSSIFSIISFALFIRERQKRKLDRNFVHGFLKGIKSLAKGMAAAGDEWRYDVEKKSPERAISYANDSTNTWITLREQINSMITELE